MDHLVRNVASLYVVRALGVLAAIGLFPYIASNVTTTEFGTWLLIGSVGLVIASSDLGMGTSVVRYVADARARGDGADANRVIASTVAFFAAFGVVAAAVLVVLFTFGFDLFTIPDAERGVTLAVVVIVAGANLLVGLPLGVFRQVLVGLHRMDLANVTLLAQILLRVVTVVLALEAGWGIIGVVAAEATAVVVAGGLSLILARRLFAGLRLGRKHVSLATLRRMASYSLLVFVMGLASLAILQGGTAVIGVLLPVAVVTLYTAAFRIYQVCRDITGALLQAIVPEASRAAAAGDVGALRTLLLLGTKFGNAVIIALVFPVILFAEPLLVAWVGGNFAPAAPVAQVLLASLLVNNNHLVGIGLLTGTGRVSEVACYHVVWAASSLGLGFILVPEVGLVGVALGLGLPLLVLEPLYVRAACREANATIAVFFREAVLVPYASALLPAGFALAVVVLWPPLGVLAIVTISGSFVAIFAGIFLRLGLRAHERSGLARLMRRSRDGTTGTATTLVPSAVVAGGAEDEVRRA